jgi:hypothetical protein
VTLIAAWDVRSEAWYRLTGNDRDQIRAWVTEHGIATTDTYRTEIHIVDCPLIRVFKFAPRVNGNRPCDPSHPRDPLRLPPYDVLIKTDPPACLCPKVLP